MSMYLKNIFYIRIIKRNISEFYVNIKYLFYGSIILMNHRNYVFIYNFMLFDPFGRICTRTLWNFT